MNEQTPFLESKNEKPFFTFQKRCLFVHFQEINCHTNRKAFFFPPNLVFRKRLFFPRVNWRKSALRTHSSARSVLFFDGSDDTWHVKIINVWCVIDVLTLSANDIVMMTVLSADTLMMTVLMRWYVDDDCVDALIRWWWLCWCADTLMMTVLMRWYVDDDCADLLMCWSVLRLKFWRVADTLIICWCGGDCLDV
jgi:hypothetical protein